MVITDEMKKKEINKSDLLPLSFLSLSPYTGSKRGIRFRLEKVDIDKDNKNPEEKALLRCYAWRGKMSFSNTPPSKIMYKDVEFSDKGIEEALSYLNGLADDNQTAQWPKCRSSGLRNCIIGL